MSGRLAKPYVEFVLLAVFSLSFLSAVVLWADLDLSRREVRRNVALALMQCGKMLRDGEREALARDVARLTASEEVMRSDAYLIAKRFRETVLPGPTAGEGTTAIAAAGILLNGVLIWGVLTGAWLIAYLRRYRPERRRLLLVVLTGIGLILFAVAVAGRMVDAAYRSNAIRQDLRTLSEALAKPEPPPELLPQLEKPRHHSYWWLRLP